MKLLSLGRKLLTLLPLLFLLGSGLLMFFVLLSGLSSSSPTLNKFYWLELDTPNLGQFSRTKWTNYRLCSASGSSQCGGAKLALPISPKDNFGSSSNLARDFVSNRNAYYYESRIGWLFLLIATVFTLLAILGALPLLCLSSSIVISLATFTTMVLFVFMAVSALLYTHIVTKAKKTFENNGQDLSVGTKMMAFVWTSVLLLLLSSLITFLLGCFQFAANRYDKRLQNKEYSTLYYSDEDDVDEETYNNDLYARNNTGAVGGQRNSSLPFWKKNKSTAPLAAAGGTAGTAGAGAGATYATSAPVQQDTTTSTQPSKINFFRVRNNRSAALDTQKELSKADNYGTQKETGGAII